MATVVVVLAPTPRVSSTPTLRSLIGSSVRSGLTSLIAPTRVVFPTPKPPAMRILAVDGTHASSGASSKRFESIEHHPQQALFSSRLALREDNPQHPFSGEVGEQNTHHPDGKVELGDHVGDRGRAATEGEDPPVFGSGPEMRRRPLAGREDQVDQAKRLLATW